MRILKLGLISVVFLFGIVTAISLLIPAHIRLAKVITVKADKDTIFNLIKNKDQWQRWHPSFLNGQRMDMLSGIKTTVVSQTDSVLMMRWEQEGKKPLDMGWQLFQLGEMDQTTLQWYIDFHLSWYPWEKIGSLFYESNYGAMMEQGLLNIKDLVEKPVE